jgi:hypothetical protein
MEYEIKYAGFSPRNYVAAIEEDGRNNIPLIDPTSFFLARWYLTPATELKDILRRWQEPRPKEYVEVIDLNREYLLDVGDVNRNQTPKRTRKNLAEITAEQFAANVREAIKRQYGCYNMFDMDARDIFFLDKDEESLRPFGGDLMLSGRIKPKSGGNQGRNFDAVSITGPFNTSQIPLARISSQSDDARYGSMKMGYHAGEYLDTTAAALLCFASQNPKQIKNLEAVMKRRPAAKIWLPYNPYNAQEDLPIEGVVYSAKRGQQPSMDFLMTDVILDFVMNGSSKYETAKKVAKIPVIYDRMLYEKIRDGQARFTVLPNKYVFERSNPIDSKLREWHNRMHGELKRWGFEFKGLVLEKKDSEHEVVAMDYRKGSESVRLLFSKDYPPVYVKRAPRKDAVSDVFWQEKRTGPYEYQPPFAELFQPKQMFDDSTRIVTNYEVKIPTMIWLSDEMIRDYKKAIAAFYPGGVEAFSRKIHALPEFKGDSEESRKKRGKLRTIIGARI